MKQKKDLVDKALRFKESEIRRKYFSGERETKTEEDRWLLEDEKRAKRQKAFQETTPEAPPDAPEIDMDAAYDNYRLKPKETDEQAIKRMMLEEELKDKLNRTR